MMTLLVAALAFLGGVLVGGLCVAWAFIEPAIDKLQTKVNDMKGV